MYFGSILPLRSPKDGLTLCPHIYIHIYIYIYGDVRVERVNKVWIGLGRISIVPCQLVVDNKL